MYLKYFFLQAVGYKHLPSYICSNIFVFYVTQNTSYLYPFEESPLYFNVHTKHISLKSIFLKDALSSVIYVCDKLTSSLKSTRARYKYLLNLSKTNVPK